MPSNSTAATANAANRRKGGKKYTSVASDDMDEGETVGFQDEPLSEEALTDDDNEDLPLTLTILDSAQKRFPVPCDPHWTVGTFKERSAKIHKVAPPQQRLIFRGRMLTNDDQTLEECKLDTNDLIVHLFPKPRVVVTKTAKTSSDSDPMVSSGASADSGIVDDAANAGAHIPSIVIDQEEQDRRGQILVLGSVEIAESQNNVKMLSLLLVMICAMRLLSLMSIAMGAAAQPDQYNHYDPNAIHNHTGDTPHHGIYDSDFTDASYETPHEPRTWQTTDWYDLLVSALGFYVGTLGMKATQANTSRLALQYAVGTIFCGIGWTLWNVWSFWDFYQKQIAKEAAAQQLEQNQTNTPSQPDNNHHDHPFPDYNNYDKTNENNTDLELTRDDYVTVAFFTVLMPLFVWFLCCVRAFEFRRLIREAEEEAAERIRNEYTVTDNETNETNETEATAEEAATESEAAGASAEPPTPREIV